MFVHKRNHSAVSTVTRACVSALLIASLLLLGALTGGCAARQHGLDGIEYVEAEEVLRQRVEVTQKKEHPYWIVFQGPGCYHIGGSARVYAHSDGVGDEEEAVAQALAQLAKCTTGSIRDRTVHVYASPDYQEGAYHFGDALGGAVVLGIRKPDVSQQEIPGDEKETLGLDGETWKSSSGWVAHVYAFGAHTIMTTVYR